MRNVEREATVIGAATPAPLDSNFFGKAKIGAVVAVLRDRIATHTIPPGTRLREQDVSEGFALARVHAREALDALVYLGFCIRQPNRGVAVRHFDLASIRDFFDLREVNEGLCARMAAGAVAKESWESLVELFGAPMGEAVEHDDLAAYLKHYELMRGTLVAAAKSPALAELLGRLYDFTRVFARRVLLFSDRTKSGLLDHRSVLAALRRGDAEAAERQRRATIANIKAAVERYHTYIT